MNITSVNRHGRFQSFSGTPKENNQDRGSGLGFIAGSTALGAGIGALTPDKLVIQNSSEVTKENLNNLLGNFSEYAKNSSQKSSRKLKEYAQSAKQELSRVFDKVGGSLSSRLDNLQAKYFEKLKPHLPTESRWYSASRGAAIGGVIGTGLVITSKLLKASRPPQNIEDNPFENTSKLTIVQYEES